MNKKGTKEMADESGRDSEINMVRVGKCLFHLYAATTLCLEVGALQAAKNGGGQNLIWIHCIFFSKKNPHTSMDSIYGIPYML